MQKTRYTYRTSVYTILLIFSADILAGEISPRIVNGVKTQEYASTGALLYAIPGFNKPPYYVGQCTGTMVGCQTFLTAAHCVCANFPNGHSFSTCTIEKPENLRVFLQNGGIYQIAEVNMNPAYNFTIGTGDTAVLTLKDPITSITPAKINTVNTPAHDTSGKIVGFGVTDGSLSDFGIKREGSIITGSCDGAAPEPDNLCWTFANPVGPAGTDSDTCYGDSGGPLFIDMGAGQVVAGVTSSGTNSNCQTPDISIDANVYLSTNRNFIQAANSGITKPITKCRAGFRKLVGNYVKRVIAAQQRCLNAVNAGKTAEPCPDAKAQSAVLKAAAALDAAKIAKSCPDHTVADSNLTGVCATAESPEDLGNCIENAGTTAVTQMLDVEYADSAPLEAIADKDANKCQAAVAGATKAYLSASINALNQCQTQKDKGKVSICPDEHTQNKIAKLAGNMGQKIAKACSDVSVASLDSNNAFGGSCSGAMTTGALSACELTEHNNIANELTKLSANEAMDFNASFCGADSQVGDGKTVTLNLDQSFGTAIAARQFEHTFTLPAGLASLRVTLNADESFDATGNSNDVDLYIKFNATPIPDPAFAHPDANAYSINYGVFEAVEIKKPQSGTWHVVVAEVGEVTGKPYQLTVTEINP